MSTTKMRAGRLVAIYIDDGQGRRLVLAQPMASGFAIDRPLVIGDTQKEVREVIATLKQLAEELPP